MQRHRGNEYFCLSSAVAAPRIYGAKQCKHGAAAGGGGQARRQAFSTRFKSTTDYCFKKAANGNPANLPLLRNDGSQQLTTTHPPPLLEQSYTAIISDECHLPSTFLNCRAASGTSASSLIKSYRIESTSTGVVMALHGP
jgi:hypothetical protein